MEELGTRTGERRIRSQFVLPERRTGFDRRQLDRRYVGGLYSLGRSVPQLLALITSILLLSAADFGLTAAALAQGGVELNPVMARLFAIGPLAAAAFKACVLALVLLVVWKMRHYRRILELALGVLLLHFSLFAYHLVNLSAA